MSTFDRPANPPDTPSELDGGVRRAPERTDTWLNPDHDSDEKLASFLGLDRPVTAKPSADALQRADKPHEVKPPQADCDVSGHW